MNQAQTDALKTLAGRTLTDADIAILGPLVDIRNDVDIAAHLSIGRKKLQRVADGVGSGTVVVVMAPRGGAFLDAVEVLGQTDRDVYWGMDSIRRGVFDPGLAAGQAWLDKLASEMPDYSAELARVKTLGYVDDPLQAQQVSDKLNKAEGRMTL